LSVAKESELKLQRLERDVQDTQRRIDEKTAMIDHLLDASSDDKLHTELSNFDVAMQSRKNELYQLQGNVDSMNLEIAILRSETDQYNVKRGQIVILQDQIKTLKEQQHQLGSTLMRKYALSISTSTDGANSGSSSSSSSSSSNRISWTPETVANIMMSLTTEVR